MFNLPNTHGTLAPDIRFLFVVFATAKAAEKKFRQDLKFEGFSETKGTKAQVSLGDNRKKPNLTPNQGGRSHYFSQPYKKQMKGELA